MISARFEPGFEGWRAEAKRFLSAGVKPDEIQWSTDIGSLFGPGEELNSHHETEFSVTREFYELAKLVSCAKEDDRWDLLYRLLYRIRNGEPSLLKNPVDPDVARAHFLSKNVKRDIHKMHAFVRFKKIVDELGHEHYLAWYEPTNHIVELAAPFFVRRFGDKPFTIFTPEASANWDGKDLSYGPGLSKNKFPHDDNMDDLWRIYYSSIFNPARVKIKAMQAEMPRKYWKTLPEAEIIDELIQKSPARLQEMARQHRTRAVVPANADLPKLKAAASVCTGCPLYAGATQTVFGEGPENAEIMIIGEQPGTEEDLQGHPFVGPAGKILNQALHAAGLKREDMYLTNAVKHFKWQRQGKIRVHKKPNGSEMHACKPWLDSEIAKIKPKTIVLLGATAATAVLGRLPKITEERGKVITGNPLAERIILSWHPAAILRSSTDEESLTRMNQLAQDLALAKGQKTKVQPLRLV